MTCPEQTPRTLRTIMGLLGVLGGVFASRGARASRSGLAVVCVPVLVLVSLALVVSPALALETHVFSKSFASKGPGAGQVEDPAGVAVDSVTHDVYVADTGNDRVDEFTAGGVFVRAWGWGVGTGLGGFETCTEMLGCKAGVSGSGAGQFEAPMFIAVDNSTGPSKGDVYVGDTGDNLVTKFTENGVLEGSWGDTTPTPNGQLAGKDTPGTSFAPVAGIAVDPAGNLDVLSEISNYVYRFEQDGKLAEEFLTLRQTGLCGLAVDEAGDLFKSLNGCEGVEKLNSVGEDVGTIEEGGSTRGIATAGSDLYLLEGAVVKHYGFPQPLLEPAVVSEQGGSTCTIALDAPCPQTDSFGFAGELTEASGIAVDSSDQTVFVADAGTGRVDVFTGPVTLPDVTTGPPEEIKPHTSTLTGTVTPDGISLTECRFQVVDSEGYEQKAADPYHAGQSVPCAEGLGEGEGEIGKASEPVAVHAEVTGLTPGTEYHYRLLAANSNGANPGADGTFSTPPPPALTEPSVTGLSAESADLHIQVNPHGVATTCVFEVGETTGYGEQFPCSPQPGSAVTPVAISQHVGKLEPDKTYHWRVVATSEAGTTLTPDHTFIYDESATSSLPDGRAYEMVTPPHKNAALIGDLPFTAPPDVSEDGERVLAETAQCFPGAQSCLPLRGVAAVGVPYEFSRTASGWVTTPLAPPASEFAANSFFEYGYTTDAAGIEEGTALFSAPTPPSGEDDFYAREPGGSFVDIGPFTPPADGPTSLDEINSLSAGGYEATGDLSHLIISAEPDWPISKTPSAERFGSMLEYTHVGSTEEPLLVGVSGQGPSTSLIDACKTRYVNDVADDGISADGSIVYFEAEPCSSGTGANAGRDVPVRELFARVDGGEPDAETLSVSEPRQLAAAEPDEECTEAECVKDIENPAPAANPNWREAKFVGSSNDGSKVFFKSEQRLTNGASEGSNNLYLYDKDSPLGHRLIDVSAGEGGVPAAGGPRVAVGPGVLALSSDGSHVYFVAQGKLTRTPNAEGQTAVDGANNLYMFERRCPEGEAQCATHVQRTAFIAALPNSEEGEWKGLGEPANVTPDGRFLVFTSRLPLTSDTTRTDGATQVYRYDAQSGRLQRLSIGERGFNDDGNAGAGDAQIVRGKNGYAHLGAGHPDPTMSDDGSRVFFMSPVALTAGALNDVSIGTQTNDQGGTGTHVEPAYAENVYEWEQAGAGSCAAEEAAGCVFLISDGHDTSIAPAEDCYPNISAVCLLGTDATGKNVFFTTADQLLPQDTDTQLDFYDARVCEPENGNPCITEPPPSPAPCLEEACHGIPPERSALLSGGSSTFNGPLNSPPAPPAVVKKVTKKTTKCKRGFTKNKKNKCVRRKKKARAKKSAKERK